MKLAALYETDRTGWLEATAKLVRKRRYREVDVDNLARYLQYWARRDRREVVDRLVALLVLLLKLCYEPEGRSRRRQSAIFWQQLQLEMLLESETLRRYAQEKLAGAYARAVRKAATQTGLSEEQFPKASPYTVDELEKKELWHKP